MLIQNIALVPEAGSVTPAELLRVSAALQKQVSSHFGPCWGIQASVDPFLELEQVPAGYLPIVLSAPESAARVLDIALDSNGQPYARVSLNAGWSLAASRACLELLLNPFGQRTVNAASPRSDQGPVEILVEACGAFGEMPTAYAVNDVAVSDFCTPAFFRAQGATGGESYSFRGALSAPLSLLRGGHLAWFDAISNNWWLRSFHDENPIDRALGPLQARGRSLREQILRHEPHGTGSALSHEPLDARIRWQWLREQASAASVARAERLRASLGLPVGTRQYQDEDDEETVAMALSAPRIEPSRGRRSSPPPLPNAHGGYVEQRLESGGPGTSLERERNVIVTTHERHTASVIVETRDPSVSQAAIERRDTLPLTQLLPPPAQRSEPTPQIAHPVEPAPAVSPEPKVEAPALALTPVPTPSRAIGERPRGVIGTVSHSSIPPIAMLAEPARNEGSRAGLMLAAAGAAALVVVAVMSGTRSAAHIAQAPSPKPAVAAAIKPDAGKTALLAPVPPQPVVAAPAPGIEARPNANSKGPAPAAKAERSRASERTTQSEASREREEARERRRQREQQEIAPASAPAEESASQGPRTAAIENLFDTRR